MLEKGNKNFTNGTIALDRARAVYLFNEEMNKFVEWTLQKKSNTNVQDIQQLLSTKSLTLGSSTETYDMFTLPKDFFSFVNISKLTASGQGYFSVPMLGYQAKPENIHELLVDENNKPSIKHRETPYTLEGNAIKVYKDNFKIDTLGITYYRYPRQFNLEGYITEDNQNSFNSDPEFEDRIVDRIISMCITSFDINNENFNKVPVDINRVVSKH